MTTASTGLSDEVTAVAQADVLSSLEEAATALADLISGLLDLEGLAATELMAVEVATIGVTAVSTGETGTSTAVAGCTRITARVLGESFTTPSCSEGLSAAQGIANTVTDAVGTVESVLAGLPLTDVAAVGDLQLEMFGMLKESVVQDGDYVVSTAQIELLELNVPALTIDPAKFAGDVLADLFSLDIESVLGAVETQLATATADLDGFAALGGALPFVRRLTSAGDDPTGSRLAGRERGGERCCVVP